MYLALKVTKLSFVEIAKRVGGINWKNVVAGARTIEHRMGEDPKFAAEVQGIEAALLPTRPSSS
jgi:chromosomal replication initiation ATPase DnaA